MSKHDGLNPDANIQSRRATNDDFRKTLTGGAVMVSRGVIDLGGDNQRAILDAVRGLKDFDDDRQDDRSVGDLEVACRQADSGTTVQLVFFHIKAVNDSNRPSLILTVMLANEWWHASPHDISSIDDDEDEPVITEVEDCTGETEDPDRSLATRKLNDVFRLSMTGGTVVITAAIAALAANLQLQVIEAVKSFDAFTEDRGASTTWARSRSTADASFSRSITTT